ncbi:MAG: hypothetical protein ACYDIE_14475 [Candidatus Krumholzibacteriia bacterium]
MNRTPATIGLLVVAVTAIVSGCTRDRESVRSADATAAYRARFETLVIPDGTNVIATLDTRLSSETNRSGDRFGVTTIAPIIVDGRTALPAGARIHGVLRGVEASGRMQGRARMTLTYQGLVDSEGMTREISALPLALEAASTTRGDVATIAAGSILGAVVGGIAGGEEGAVIGAGAGAGAGAIITLATRGEEIELESGQRLNVQMISSTRIQVMALR